ncbi:MAG: hypothetical protein P8Y61_12240 [Gammaproteobacteria bacterium]|jgi:hypothetical protein
MKAEQDSTAGDNKDESHTLVLAAIVALGIGVTIAVASIAWVSEDSFITFRYIANTLNGYGAVFNLGEYVLGYTHPLWFLLLLPGTLLAGDPILVAVAYGLLLTLATLIALGLAVNRAAAGTTAGLWVFATGAVVLLASDAWLSFQTGGLENPLSHFLMVLIVVEAVCHATSRPGRLTLLLTLLCLCRPDFVFFGLPLGLLVLSGINGPRDLAKLALAASPGIVWLLFGWVYYGQPLPNTGTAKLGIFGTWQAATAQGLTYLYDWFIYEPITVTGAAALLACAVWLRRDRIAAALAAGIVLQTLWAVWAGGDFMRGRFFMGVLTAAVALGTLTLAEYAGRKRASAQKPAARSLENSFRNSSENVSENFSGNSAANAVAMSAEHSVQASLANLLAGPLGVVFAALLLGGILTIVPGPGLRSALPPAASGIVSERDFYRDYSLEYYLTNGKVKHPVFDLNIADELRNYADDCDRVAIHVTNPGTLGYLAGPQVTLIDTLGLTDRFIAELPKALLVSKTPRPGHPEKYIPVGYLADRGDVAIFDNWIERVANRDCTLKDEVSPYAKPDYFLTPDARFVKIEFVGSE